MIPTRLMAPHRLPGESFVAYKARRREVGKIIEEYLRGAMFVTSARVIQLPAVCENEKIDEAIRQGQFRRAMPVVTRAGTDYRVAVTKGETWRKPK